MFDSTTRTVVVVGAQWGDEGKGKLVDVLAERADWVVRYQGGANAGHTVHIGDVSFVLHQIPRRLRHPRGRGGPAGRAGGVVRARGGANAGHTVHIGDVSFVLHQIPSGILHPGVRCAIGNGVVLDPDTLFHEIDELVGDGGDVEGQGAGGRR